MALLDDIRKSMTEISKNPETVVKKSEDAVRLQRAKLQKRMLEKDLDACYAQIGRLYLDAFGGGEVPEQMKPVITRIRACMEAIEETQRRISGSE